MIPSSLTVPTWRPTLSWISSSRQTEHIDESISLAGVLVRVVPSLPSSASIELNAQLLDPHISSHERCAHGVHFEILVR